MKIKYSLSILTLAVSCFYAQAQVLPLEFNYSSDGHRLIVGNTETKGFYDETQVDTLFLQFSQTNYWTLLAQNYEDKIEIPATLTHNGVVYDSVGVRFKGNTSYKRLGNSDKKSFAISMDGFIDGQDIEGYESLNLSNAFQDETAMREIVYLNGIRKHIAAAKGNYVQLYINGQNWGVYPNVQALNKEHVGEWFLDNDATRWRCEASVDLGPTSPRFNVGFSSLNYLGDAASDYTNHYTLKSADKADPWLDLAVACSLIDKTTSSAGVLALRERVDLDQTLWFLASEIMFTDDDGYVFKGGMDYYAYFDVATNRLLPIEYDGNSCMAANKATSWTPFYKETDADFVLMNKLMKVPEIRQRYLAHFRTMLRTSFDTARLIAQIDNYSALMSQRYANDPKAMSTFQEHTTEIANLKQFVRTRSNYLWSNAEIMQQGVAISDVSHFVNVTQWADPKNSEKTLVLATAASPSSVQEMNLFMGTGLAGNFTSLPMFDDGSHGDGAAGDGQFGVYIPEQVGGQYVRYYIESVANNSANTRVYEPAGAEHEVFIYQVKTGSKVESEVVINEVMASNKVSIADQDNEYDDWIELYNNGNATVDISGYYLTDNNTEFLQWQFPAGTTIDAGEYLIVWCDNDLDQKGLHANFKLSSNGETVYLVNAQGNIADEVVFGEYKSEYTYSRVPNGTGNFDWQHPTHDMSNETSLGMVAEEKANRFAIFPNPAIAEFTIDLGAAFQNETLSIFNVQGGLVIEQPIQEQVITIDASSWKSGVYIVRVGNGEVKRVIINP
jgi:predicted RNA-binding protein with TRAM domain